MNDVQRLTLSGLSEFDLLELEEELPEGALELVAGGGQREGSMRHGDLGLSAAVVLLTGAAIHGLAVWLAKRRVKVVSEEVITIERDSNGALTATIHRRQEGSRSEPPSPEVVQALKTDLEQVLRQAS